MRNAKEGTYNGEITYCTVNCWNKEDCPYAENGICHIEDPIKDCEDFAAFFSAWEEWENAGTEPEENPDEAILMEMEYAMDEMGYNPYMGGYDYDC